MLKKTQKPLFDTRQRIAGELVIKKPKSREGDVFITAKYVYKIFGKKTNPYDEIIKYKCAETKGVPVPDTAVFIAPLQEGETTEEIKGIRFTIASGQFFQLGKKGGIPILTNEINKITDKKLLEIIIKGLENAANFGVIDPQGFIDINNDSPLTFIDLHCRTLRTQILFEPTIQAARKKLDELSRN